MQKIAISSSIVAVFLILIQTAVFSHIPFFLITADLVLIFISFVAINNGSRLAMILGFFSGLLLDFMSISPFGLSSFVLVFVAFFLGKLYGHYNLTHFIFPFILAVLVTFIKFFLLLLLHVLFSASIKTYSVYDSVFLIELALNIVFAPCLFFSLNRFPSFFKS
ncbi:MAG: rod shape-determining protein MreD [Treponema sp.]